MPANRTQSRLDFGPAGNWNAIEARAREFVSTWNKAEGYERGESVLFWTQLLGVFGVDPKRVGAFFEYRTRKLKGDRGYVDLFWPGKLVAEQKSAGRDLDRAITQALDYLPAMPDHELPRAIVASDFRSFDIVRLDDPSVKTSFALEQLPEKVRAFSFLFDVDDTVGEQSPVNIKAAQDIAKLHEALKARGYTGKDLEIFLSRVVFCLFAEDTGIFDRGQFSRYVRNQSSTDGRNLGRVLNELFEVLDTANADRMQGMDHTLAEFPYVNGGLFAGSIRTPSLDTESRSAILTASLQDWAQVNPSIFGSMFQGVMDEVERRNLGAHYTSEKNILRLIQPLFIDDLYAELEAAKGSPTRLDRLHDKLANLKFLDPACGSGNFLVITYRELRKLEHLVIQEKLRGQRMLPLEIAHLIRVTPDQMAGIELEEFPAKVAQLALWLTDHQMNREAAAMFGGSIDIYARIPISSQPNIVQANALRIDWGDVVELSDLDFIVGNPPFVGKHYQSAEMKADLAPLFKGIRGAGNLDYVTGWYVKSAQAMNLNPAINAALVSTNSISQGQQVASLWEALSDADINITFAHRTFQWKNEAPGVAAVHCVIIGFQKGHARKKRRLYKYATLKGEPTEAIVSNINPYLVDAPDIIVNSSRTRVSLEAPPMVSGGKPVDGGHLLLSSEEKNQLLRIEPGAKPFIRPFTMGEEFINGEEKWCLWLVDVEPSTLRALPAVMSRVQKVREARLKSPKEPTRRSASTPTLFQEVKQSETAYLAIPEVSSENREYIPMGWLPSEMISGNKIRMISDAELYHFGILTSVAHMDWMRSVAGRMKSDYSYSVQIVYNNFPWPESVTDAQRAKIEELAQAVLDAREAHPTSTLADLYDPVAMPPNLRKAHTDLDRAVDRLYRAKPFADDAERVALLLKRYQVLTQG